MTVELMKTAVISAFGHHVFGTFRDKANIIIQQYAVPCWLSTDHKIRDLD